MRTAVCAQRWYVIWPCSATDPKNGIYIYIPEHIPEHSLKALSCPGSDSLCQVADSLKVLHVAWLLAYMKAPISLRESTVVYCEGEMRRLA